jgi:hypothetical protein
LFGKGLFHLKRKPPVAGISIALLQKCLERYSDERLNAAMAVAFGRPYDDKTFFAMNIFDGDGAVFKVDGFFIGLEHFDRRADGACFGDIELPEWAKHKAHSIIHYRCPGGLPEVELREKFTAFSA